MNDNTSDNLTLEKLLQAKKEIDSLSDPLEDFMREKGFDPKRTMLILPKSCQGQLDWGRYGSPSYVRFSALCPHDQALLIRKIEY